MTTTPTDELATIFREALEQDPACTFAAPACLSRIALRHALIVGDHAEAVVDAPRCVHNAPPQPPPAERPVSLSDIAGRMRDLADRVEKLPFRRRSLLGGPMLPTATLRDEADYLDAVASHMGQVAP
jgi:hypothetical protein